MRLWLCMSLEHVYSPMDSNREKLFISRLNLTLVVVWTAFVSRGLCVCLHNFVFCLNNFFTVFCSVMFLCALQKWTKKISGKMRQTTWSSYRFEGFEKLSMEGGFYLSILFLRLNFVEFVFVENFVWCVKKIRRLVCRLRYISMEMLRKNCGSIDDVIEIES